MVEDLNKSEVSKETKTYEGSQIEGLFSKPQSIDLIVEHETYGKIKFVVKPMNNDIYAQMADVMKSSGIDVENATNIDALKVFSNVYYPAMKVVFPFCSITPKIVVGDTKEEGTLSLNVMPMDICMDLFNQIMRVSGMGDQEIKTRKKD